MEKYQGNTLSDQISGKFHVLLKLQWADVVLLWSMLKKYLCQMVCDCAGLSCVGLVGGGGV